MNKERYIYTSMFKTISWSAGQAAHLSDSVAMMQRLGTAGYVAPEVLDTRRLGRFMVVAMDLRVGENDG